MANSLTVAGSSRLSWSLSNADVIGSAAAAAEHRTSRAITNGTGPGYANAANTQRITCTGSGVSLAINALNISVLGVAGQVAFTTLKELLVSVASGPTGGYLNLQAPGGITGARVGVGGQLHWADYQVGATGTTVALSGGPTGTYVVDLTLVGEGTYS